LDGAGAQLFQVNDRDDLVCLLCGPDEGHGSTNDSGNA
jgi:hypothetical protein